MGNCREAMVGGQLSGGNCQGAIVGRQLSGTIVRGGSCPERHQELLKLSGKQWNSDRLPV